jgi:hypothetical protein
MIHAPAKFVGSVVTSTQTKQIQNYIVIQKEYHL